MSVLPLDSIFESIEDGVKYWLGKNTPERIKKDVSALLDKNKKTIIFKLMGFDNRFGQWEVDHCNGRAGNTTMSDYVNTQIKYAVDAWVKNIDFPEVDQAITDALVKEYRYKLREQLNREIANAASNESTRITDGIISQIADETAADVKKQTLALLIPK